MRLAEAAVDEVVAEKHCQGRAAADQPAAIVAVGAHRVEGQDQREKGGERHAVRMARQERASEGRRADREEGSKGRPTAPGQRHRNGRDKDRGEPAPTGDRQASRRRDPELELDRNGEAERDEPVAPPIHPGANAHPVKVLRASPLRIIPRPDPAGRRVDLRGYEEFNP